MISEEKSKFYGCYLLYCLNPKYKGRTYIGFTVDPNRRIKQHNGGVQKGGAYRTSNKGPWEMVLTVHGFPNEISALRFEWAWQHPFRSRRLKRVVANKKSTEKNFAFYFRVLTEMLRIGPWNRLALTIQWLKEDYHMDFDLLKQPPVHMAIRFGPITSWKKPKDTKDVGSENASVPMCKICDNLIVIQDHLLQCLHVDCEMTAHIFCLAKTFLSSREQDKDFCLPLEGDCPICEQNLLWGELIRFQHQIQDIKQPQNVLE
ncbi:structure-specific endonuclease subunit SLX1 homolog [Dendronephthya gigantea]|uniref:structure-specific endonuclease subunit SLX1 homolog n=1 Tax=Dendronephthya gigantea TaxID=151771 RepID=UPI001068F671|nr:structure-specific endonuclease subunit SLX1 homolog [Dendronephthya gigantea]